jgi:hypothetical protein
MARKVDEADNFVFVQLIEKEPGIYMKNATQAVLGRTEEICLGKDFLMRRRSLDPG